MASTPSSMSSYLIVENGFSPTPPEVDIRRWQDSVIEAQKREMEPQSPHLQSPVPVPKQSPDRTSIKTTQTLRTIEDVRDQAVNEIVVKAIMKATVHDGVKVSVKLTMSHRFPEEFLQQVAERAASSLEPGGPFLFAFYTAMPSQPSSSQLAHNTLAIVGSDELLVARAKVLTESKFVGRMLTSAEDEGHLYMATILDPCATSSSTSSYEYPPEYDLPAITDVIQKAVRRPLNPLQSPPGSQSIDVILAHARAKLQRVSPAQAYEEMRGNDPGIGAPVVLVDIRPQSQREEFGEIPGAILIERNVLEWRFDPRCEARLPIASRYDLRIIIFCQEGYASSLAARDLQRVGLLNSTDIIGGYRAWKEAELPTREPYRRGIGRVWERGSIALMS